MQHRFRANTLLGGKYPNLNKRYLTGYLLVSFVFGSFAQEDTTPRIDSIYINASKKIIQPQTLDLSENEDNVLLFLQPCSPRDSVAFQWEGVDVVPEFCRNGEARYTNIKGGHYSFHIGRFEKGIFQKKRTLPINVAYTISEEPLFFPSLLFSILLIFAGIIYFWISYNFRQRMNVQNLRNQIASDLHDEVGSTLSSIAVLSKVLRRNMTDKIPESLPVLDKILESAKDTIINLRDTVWTINPDNDSLEKMLGKMRSFAYEMLVGEEIALNYHSTLDEHPNDYKKMQISMEQRRNAYLMFKECVHNIVKHANATAAKIDVSLHADGILFLIEDNGKGFDQRQEAEGNGLKNLRRRAEECFMELDITSAVQQGTKIRLFVPEL
jgi:hypothetical protein